MAVTGLRAFLRRHRRIAVDSSIFIYHLEGSPGYGGLANEVFEWIETPGHAAVTSTVSMLEIVVQPYGEANEELAILYYGLLSRYPHLEWIAPSLEIADIAARLRARHRLKTPDALQAATAIKGRATGLVTNDAAFEGVELLETAVLDRLA